MPPFPTKNNPVLNFKMLDNREKLKNKYYCANVATSNVQLRRQTRINFNLTRQLCLHEQLQNVFI